MFVISVIYNQIKYDNNITKPPWKFIVYYLNDNVTLNITIL